MLFLFRNIIVAFLILFISVLGISGGILLLYLTNTPLNVGSYTGLIMMVGIIGENAIFTYLQFHESLASKTKEQAIIYAISTRLRPKLMTALGAIIALMPLALGIGTGAQMHQPLAIAVIGGFLVALPLFTYCISDFIKQNSIKTYRRMKFLIFLLLPLAIFAQNDSLNKQTKDSLVSIKHKVV